MPDLRAPFPYFGGKRLGAALIWDGIGPGVRTLLIPCAGGLGEYLGAPGWALSSLRHLIVNDADGLLSNVWRSIHQEPAAVAEHAAWPVMEADLHARHAWLVGSRESLTEQLIADPTWCDPRAAGWWVWGASCWIGRGWCEATARQIPHLAGGSAVDVHRTRPDCKTNYGQSSSPRYNGVERPPPPGTTRREWLAGWFRDLSERLDGHNLRVCSGDFTRILGTSVRADKPTAIVLDPPYLTYDRDAALYAVECDDPDRHVALRAMDWAIEHGDEPGLRIVLCGLEGHYDMPEGWRCERWSTGGGYGNQGKGEAANRHREVMWFSPGCESRQRALFA